jgi:hypothetical protein
MVDQVVKLVGVRGHRRILQRVQVLLAYRAHANMQALMREKIALEIMTDHAIADTPGVQQHPTCMLTGAQIRAARGLLGWSAGDLALRAGLSYATIQRAESADGVPTTQGQNLYAIQQALAAGGVEFINDGQISAAGGPGVRLRRP